MVIASLVFVVSILLLIVSALSFYKWGYWALLSILPLLGVVIYKVGGEADVFPLLMAPIVIGSIAGITYKTGRSLQFFLVSSALLVAIITSAHYFYMLEYKNVDLLSQMKEDIVMFLDSSTLEVAEKDQIKKALPSSVELKLIRSVIPFSYFINGLVWSVIGLFILKISFVFISRKKFIFTKGLEFFKLNDYVIFALITCLAFIVFADSKNTQLLYFVMLNCLFILTTLYFVQALAIVRFLLITKKWPTFFLPLAFLVIMQIGIKPLLVVILMMAGWGTLDLWTDFRNFNKPKENNNSNGNS